MSEKPKIITIEILKSWNPCEDGFNRFCELLPNGGTLDECVDALISDHKDEWGKWLFETCKKDDDFKIQTLKGDSNSGDRNSGSCNSGDRNSGSCNSGDRNSGSCNSGKRNSGNFNSGHWNFGGCNSGKRNSGDWNSGHWNSGSCNSGDLNSGHWNSGDNNPGSWNAGDYNSGNYNSGDLNSGCRNSGSSNFGDYNPGDFNPGNFNSGDNNSGNFNSGNFNSGDRNSGNWNSGNNNPGCFNSTTPHEILVFNKLCKVSIWENTEKPHFIYFNTCEWIPENQMSDQEKIDNENFHTTGGFLKKIDYKEAWENAWKNSSEEDKWLLFKLPNFDEDIFKEISGIDVSEEHLKFKSYANNKGK